MAGPVNINGSEYILKPFTFKDSLGRTRKGRVRPYVIDQTAPVQAELGSSPADVRAGIQPIKFHPPYYGMGARRAGIDRFGNPEPKDQRRIWDSHGMMTWWSAKVGLGIVQTQSTDADNDERVRAAVEYKGNILTLWEDSTLIADGTPNNWTNQVRYRKYTGSTHTYSGGGVLSRGSGASTEDHTSEVVGLDIASPGANIIALMAGRAVQGGTVKDINIYTGSIIGNALTRRQNYDLLTNVPTANENIDAGLIAPRKIGADSIVALWDEDNALIVLRSSTDDWASNDTSELSIASGGGPKGIAVYPGIDGADRLYLLTREGLYEVNTSGTWVATLIFPMMPHDDNGRRAVVHDGSLWFPIGAAATEPAGMVRMTNFDGRRIFEVNVANGEAGMEEGVYLGPAAGDTCPARLTGPITFMWSSGKFLYAAVGGKGTTGGKNAWVMLHNGFGWHVAAEHGTVDKDAEIVFTSGADNSIPRLHWSITDGDADSDTYYQEYPESNPVDGQTVYVYIASAIGDPSYLTRPEVNFATGDVNKNLVNVHVDAEDLDATTSGEYINATFGLNGTAPTISVTNLGDFLSGTTSIDFGSGAGVSGRSIQIRENFVRAAGDTTSTPKGRTLTIRGKPKYPTLNGYQMIVDIPGTAGHRGNPNDLKAVIDGLRTARDSVPNVAFQYAPIASTYGEVIIDQELVDIESDVTNDTTTADEVALEAHVRVEER